MILPPRVRSVVAFARREIGAVIALLVLAVATDSFLSVAGEVREQETGSIDRRVLIVTGLVLSLRQKREALVLLVAAGGGVDEHEDIQVMETPLHELARALERGELADLKLLALVQALMIRRPELFDRT